MNQYMYMTNIYKNSECNTFQKIPQINMIMESMESILEEK